MKMPGVAATLTLSVLALLAVVALPTHARADDCPAALAFNASLVNASVSKTFPDDDHLLTIELSSVAVLHGNHLGGDIATPSDDWSMHEDAESWRHHDDDGGARDDQGGKTSIPEPSTALMLGSGISALAVWRRRSRS